MMNNLLCSGVATPPPCIKWASSSSACSSPRMQRNPTFQPTAIKFSQRPLCKTKTSDLGVRAKGFGETVTISESKRRQEDETNYKNGGNKDDDDEIPKEVFDRMLVRILFSVGAPMGSGVGLLYVLGLLKDGNVWDVPTWVPLLTILLAFGTSALGIAYGTLSTSWDPSQEGSVLGWEEAQQNWPELWREEKESKR